MSRIPTPEIDNAPEASKALLEGVKKQLGSVPNMFRLIANSPEVLNGQLAFSAALNGGKLNAATRERIALAVAEINGCNYCLSAHSYIGKAFKLLDESEIDAARRGKSADARTEAALVLATELVKQRGKVGEADCQLVLAHDLWRVRREHLRGTCATCKVKPKYRSDL